MSDTLEIMKLSLKNLKEFLVLIVVDGSWKLNVVSLQFVNIWILLSDILWQYQNHVSIQLTSREHFQHLVIYSGTLSASHELEEQQCLDIVTSILLDLMMMSSISKTLSLGTMMTNRLRTAEFNMMGSTAKCSWTCYRYYYAYSTRTHVFKMFY